MIFLMVYYFVIRVVIYIILLCYQSRNSNTFNGALFCYESSNIEYTTVLSGQQKVIVLLVMRVVIYSILLCYQSRNSDIFNGALFCYESSNI